MPGRFDHKRFADWMQREAMPKAGITSQSELGRRIGIAQTTISRWFAGDRTPGFDDLEAIARVLGVGRRALYEAAGLIPVRDPAELAEITAAYEALSPEAQALLLEFAAVLAKRHLPGSRDE